MQRHCALPYEIPRNWYWYWRDFKLFLTNTSEILGKIQHLSSKQTNKRAIITQQLVEPLNWYPYIYLFKFTVAFEFFILFEYFCAVFLDALWFGVYYYHYHIYGKAVLCIQIYQFIIWQYGTVLFSLLFEML